jgi:hypothetical protein
MTTTRTTLTGLPSFGLVDLHDCLGNPVSLLDLVHLDHSLDLLDLDLDLDDLLLDLPLNDLLTSLLFYLSVSLWSPSICTKSLTLSL